VPRNHDHWITRARRAFDPRWQPGGVVLLYHRVAALTSIRNARLPENFAAYLRVIRRAGVVMPIDEMLERAREARCPNAVAVTFDDGYADLLHGAAHAGDARRWRPSVTTSAVERG
jgi:hypothetical protein